MCNCNKSGVYIASNASTAVSNGSVIPLGETTRAFGGSIKHEGDTIVVCGKDGAFKVVAVLTVSAASTGPITIELKQDGISVDGASNTVTVAGTSDEVQVVIQGVIKNTCTCASRLAFTLTGADATIDNSSVVVESWGF